MDINDIFKKSSDFNQNDKNLIKNNGVVFTSKNICEIIINKLEPKITDKICEPSVGKGVFVFTLLEYFRMNGQSIENIKLFVENNLYCFDINNNFLITFKELLNKYFNLFGINVVNYENIKCDDFLLQKDIYDIVFGNPPYVRIQNLDKDYLNKLKNDLLSVTLGNVDLYYAFLEKSIKRLELKLNQLPKRRMK